MKEPGPWLEGLIKRFVRESPANSLMNADGEPAWSDPLVGFAGGADPLFEGFRTAIGAFYWLPREIMATAFPDLEVRPEGLTVISWVLPQTGLTKEANRREKKRPAERWARSRKYGEAFNVLLAQHVVRSLEEAGFRAVAPSLSPHWSWQASERYGFASNWSERHTAYAAGLGTFGLCDGLITAAGKAMRSGSVVTNLPVAASPRPYDSPHAYCLFYGGGKCRACVARCPVGAITEEGHDKVKCRDFLFETVAAFTKESFGFESYGCGLCQTGVPCESGIPAPLLA